MGRSTGFFPLLDAPRRTAGDADRDGGTELFTLASLPSDGTGASVAGVEATDLGLGQRGFYMRWLDLTHNGSADAASTVAETT